MAYRIIKVEIPEPRPGGEEYRAIITAVLDSSDDLDALGTDYSPGSVAIVADKGVSSYMLNASGMWKEI